MVLDKTDIFMLNDEEALQLTEESNPEKAASRLLETGPGTVIIKQGSHGALVVTRNSQIQVPIYPHATVVDPTGAGDSFAGGFIGYVASETNPDFVQATIQGAAIASYTVEGFGPEGLQNATLKGIRHRVAAISQSMD
jgi:sugar/nucleoside kinase (ribokinase family)